MGACPCFAGAAKVAEKPSKTAPAPAPAKKDSISDVAKVSSEAPVQSFQASDAGYQAAAAPPLVGGIASGPPAHSAKMPGDVAAKEKRVQDFGVGSRVDVFSSTHKAWCPGFIHEMDDKEIQVTYQVVNAPPENNILMKAVPIGSADIRPPEDDSKLAFGTVVEVYSHSWNKWCPGRVEDVTDGVATVFFLYPDMDHNSEPVMKKLPVDHTDLRLPQTSNQNTLGLVVGSSVEVYSNSLNQWIPGRVQEMTDSAVVVAFHYPDMDPSAGAAIKELPMGHQDLRLPSINPAEAGYVVGIAIEVYSHSRQFWCPGQVEAITENMITCLLRYPDLPEDSEPVTKVLPVGDPDLRLKGQH